MFSKLFGKNTESEVVEKYKKDNVNLMSKYASQAETVTNLKAEVCHLEKEVSSLRSSKETLESTIKELECKVEELENSTKVTYAQGRKFLTKAKLKALRASLEAVPSGANGFSGSVSVYDKKTKRISLVQLTSKAQALEIVSKAEKGHVDIVI